MTSHSTQVITHPLFEATLPPGWKVDELRIDAGSGRLGRCSGDHHSMFVERVLAGWIPVKTLMGQVAFESRRTLDSYETSESTGVVVVGGGAARQRVATTTEGASSYILHERFVQGLDGHMWYLRVAALSHQFDAQLAQSLLNGIAVRSAQEATHV